MIEQINSGCLLPKTESVLNNLIAEADFLADYILVGGSALSIRLCHRLSEDLDFFTFEDRFDKKRIFDFFQGKNCQIVNDAHNQIDLVYDGVKLTFFNAKWNFLKPGQKGRFHIASLEHLAGMKIHALFLRAVYRDYYDIYVLSRKLSIDELYTNALAFIEGLNYKLFSMALIYVDDIADDDISHLCPKHYITKEEISEYFIDKLKKQL